MSATKEPSPKTMWHSISMVLCSSGSKMSRELLITSRTMRKVAYCVISALKLIAMTSMRSELGKINLKTVFQTRKELNLRILETWSESTKSWGINCDRYEILKIEPPKEVRRTMQLQSEAERIRRKDIIISEAMKAAEINVAEGKKQTEILKAEAHAEAVAIKAEKEKEGLNLISKVILAGGEKGQRVLNYIQKKRYYEGYAELLEKGNVTVLPDSNGQNGGSSDVLAAVAMMMANNHSGNSGNHSQMSSSSNQKTSENSNKDNNSKNNQKNTPNSDGTYNTKGETSETGNKKAGATIDWNNIQHFNDKTLDSNRKR